MLFISRLNTFFVLETYAFSSWIFRYVEKRLDKKAEVNFKGSDLTNWTKINYNAHIAQYLKK